MQGCANILERILYPHDTWDINSITFSLDLPTSMKSHII